MKYSPAILDEWMKAGFKRKDGKDISIDIVKRQQLLTLLSKLSKLY